MKTSISLENTIKKSKKWSKHKANRCSPSHHFNERISTQWGLQEHIESVEYAGFVLKREGKEMSMSQIEFKDVRKVYSNGHVGLDRINLNIEKGDFAVIVGLSG